ncbi:MAG TPA: IS200/IS605 family transposase [Pyrinomonadaceae bacterium]|jgi:REP element-mobilizing transposase RayT|nr:IS200/IS605 family transposase [Pyrinomonadaceae bacterium]
MHSFVSCLMRCVFSTKERRRIITPELQSRLYPYLGGIARENKMKALSIGGVEDHVHALLSITSTLSISKSIQLLKGNSSKWIHETFPKLRSFEWQEGYGAFSVAISGVNDTIRYIQVQKEHHALHTFSDELVSFLDKQGIKYEKWMLD